MREPCSSLVIVLVFRTRATNTSTTDSLRHFITQLLVFVELGFFITKIMKALVVGVKNFSPLPGTPPVLRASFENTCLGMRTKRPAWVPSYPPPIGVEGRLQRVSRLIRRSKPGFPRARE